MKKTSQILINKDIQQLKESATLAINLQAKALSRSGKDVVHLGFGQSPFPVPQSIQEALAKNAHQKDYLPTRGLPDLCSKIAAYHNQHFNYSVKEDFVLVGPGSKELIFQLLYLLEGPVFVPAPSWVSYGPQVNIRGKKIFPVQTKREQSYKIQASELREACEKLNNEPQKILVLNNPTNPTGAVYTQEEIESLAKVCREHHVIVISDEIYSLVNFSDRSYFGIQQCYPEGTIVTSGISKAQAAGGYRLGFCILPETMIDVRNALSAMISETYSAVSSPIQYAAAAAYESNKDLDDFISLTTKIHGAAGNYLHKRFVNMGLNCPAPEGAFYLFPDFQNFKEKFKAIGIEEDFELTKYLLEKHLIAVLPGSDFYFSSKALGVRVASVDYNGEAVLEEALKADLIDDSFVAANCTNLVKGCDRLANFLAELK
tara:strand:+ start:52521 stop:53810 length:1290 start_codon:yes stop_codon:yes gene_type:complete